MQTFETYCPFCDRPVTAALHTQPAKLVVKGVPVSFTETVAICPICGEAIGDARIEGENLDRAYAAHKALIQSRLTDPSRTNPDRCPYCGSSEIRASTFETVSSGIVPSDAQALQRVTCDVCGESWIDEYDFCLRWDGEGENIIGKI